MVVRRPTTTYPDGGSLALQVCQHHHQIVRVADRSRPLIVGLSETQGTRCSRLLRRIRLKPSFFHSRRVPHLPQVSTQRALYGTVP